jgi:hypothetical protein
MKNRIGVGRVKRDMNSKKLLTVLSRAEDAEFLQLMWATYSLQSGDSKPAKPYIKHLPEHAATELDSKFAIHPWELDNLITLLLTTEKAKVKTGKNRSLRTDTFEAIIHVINLLRKIEEAEASMVIDESNILQEMSRIAHRTFHWQRGYFHPEKIYRSLFIFGHRSAKDYFKKRFGVSLDEFTMVCTMLYIEHTATPWISTPTFTQLFKNPQLLADVLKIISRTIPEIRTETKALLSKNKTVLASRRKHTYLPSILRKYPVISDPRSGFRIVPLPEMLIYRVTNGLYYDLIDGQNNSIIAKSQKLFEEYVVKLIPAYLSNLTALGEREIGSKGAKFLTPDVLLISGGKIKVVIECKATKNNFASQFSDDLVSANQGSSDQLSKGIVQLWRFFSAARRGIYSDCPLTSDVKGLVLTLDNWQFYDNAARATVFDCAFKLAKEKYPEIIAEDQKNIAFSSIEALSNTLEISDEKGLYAAIDAASSQQYTGWDLQNILENLGLKKAQKPFPLDVNDVIPWRNHLPKD